MKFLEALVQNVVIHLQGSGLRHLNGNQAVFFGKSSSSSSRLFSVMAASASSTGDFLNSIAPPLDGLSHKGQAGRIGVLGGSIDFAGAPYYAGMAALRVGAELLYLCTADEATGPIKSYSPELMVSAVYRHSAITSADEAVWTKERDTFVEKMVNLFPRLHALAIGPGLGRNERVFEAVAKVIEAAREKNLPMIIDADGLVLVQQRPGLVKGYKEAVLTPNANEYRLISKAVLGTDTAELPALCAALDGPIVVQKGRIDRICGPGLQTPLECDVDGAPRRPGGLGDFLAGSLSVFVAWAINSKREVPQACVAACTLVRRACGAAFAKQKRAMVAPDVLEEVGGSFELLCPALASTPAHVTSYSFRDHKNVTVSLSDILNSIAPPLDGRSHKGQAGRIGVLGGSIDFAGAPYYAGMAALRVGAELLYLCTAAEATGPIKGYSPELMVSSVYSHSAITSLDESVWTKERDTFVEKMVNLFPRLHALAIGPGLGRNERVFEAVARIIEAARERNLPLIIDADGLVLVQQRPDLVKGYKAAVLTPNANEYRLIAKAVLGIDTAELPALCAALDGPIVVQKGRIDRICGPGLEAPLECDFDGAPRRPGGLGDFLAGTLAVFVGWAVERKVEPFHACVAACTLVRHACLAAFRKQKRAMVAPDVLQEVGASFEALCPADLAHP